MTTDLHLSVEWLPADGVASPALAATWCRLSIRVGNDVVTRVEDSEASSTRNSIFCSAYPLAEWAATNWWALRSHVRPAGLLRLPTTERSPRPLHDALRRHTMRAAGDGFVWPSLFIVPEGTHTSLTWIADQTAPTASIRYVASGYAWIDSIRAQTALAAFIGSVIDRLRELGVRDTLLEEEWNAVVKAPREEAAFCDAAAAFGLDPYDLEPEDAQQIHRIGAVLGDDLAEEFATAVDPSRIGEDLAWVATGLSRLAQRSAPPTGAWAALVGLHLADDRDGEPWDVGWRHGRLTREALGVAATEPVVLDGIVRARHLASTDQALQGLGSGMSGHVEVITAAGSGSNAQRFMSARAVWRAMHVEARPYLMTTAPTFEQRVERAFAAEVLAPAAGLERLVERQSGVVLAEDVERLGRKFKTSPLVISHQLENQLGLAVAS